VLWFVAEGCLGTALLFGLLPALHVSKTASDQSLQEQGRSTTRDGRRWTTGLLVAELALTLILLAGAGLMMRSFLAVYRADLAVDATVVLMPLTLPAEVSVPGLSSISGSGTCRRHSRRLLVGVRQRRALRRRTDAPTVHRRTSVRAWRTAADGLVRDDPRALL
jgi:hypothetical protein